MSLRGQNKAKYFFLCILLSRTLAFAGESPYFSDTQSSGANASPNIWFSPFLSLLLPGSDQFYEKQYLAGSAYLGAFLAGRSAYLKYHTAGIYGEVLKDEQKTPLQGARDSYGYGALGASLVQNSSFLSVLHSFKTAAVARPKDFHFIKVHDSPTDLLAAPFEFSYLKRSSTYIPLSVIAIVLAMSYERLKEESSSAAARSLLSSSERASAVFGLSYGAAVGEEAFFRGWLLPAMHYEFDSPVLANTTQGLLFGLAHYSADNRLPLVQTVLGLYWGRLTQRSGYSMREAVFQHFWWDTMVFATALTLNIHHKKKIPLLMPLLHLYF